MLSLLVIDSNATAAGADVAQTLTDPGATTAFYLVIEEPVGLAANAFDQLDTTPGRAIRA